MSQEVVCAMVTQNAVQLLRLFCRALGLFTQIRLLQDYVAFSSIVREFMGQWVSALNCDVEMVGTLL
jgi:hypothetical protein